MRMGF